MGRFDPDRYWVQIDKSSYPAVQQLIAEGAFLPTSQRLSGQGGPRWQMGKKLQVKVLSDVELKIGATRIYARLNHLPTHAYRSLVAASPWFTQYPELDDLSTALHAGLQGEEARQRLETVAAAGRQPDPVPRMVIQPQTYFASWRSQEIYIARNGNHWFLCLNFDVTYRKPQLPEVPRVDIGVDLGLKQLSVLYADDGRVSRFLAPDLSHLSTLVLSQQAQEILDHVIYASGRQEAEKVVACLNRHASRVFVERLTHNRVTQDFIHRGRSQALHDHHFSSLSQYLYAAGTPMKRIDPAMTSQTCGPCLALGIRSYGTLRDRTFTCSHCGRTHDRDVNAAQVILLRGQKAYPEYGQVS